MTSTPAVKFKPVSSPITIPVSNGEPDLGKLVQQYAASLIPIVGKDGIYLGVFYDLRPDPSKFDHTKANINPGRHDLPLTVNVGNEGLQLSVIGSDIEQLKEFLKQRAQQEQNLEGTVRGYVNAILYQAE